MFWHLLKRVSVIYDCTYVKLLWRLIEKYLGVNIGYKKILGLDQLFKEDAVVTIICFLIYKEWLVISLENKKGIHILVCHITKVNCH